MAAVGLQHQDQWHQNAYISQSVMEDNSDTSSQQTDEDLLQQADESLDMSFDPDSERFYQQQHQQAIYYQQHQAQFGTANGQQLRMQSPSGQRKAESKTGDDEDDGMYSDDDSSTASIPDENIDFSLTYALHTFLATVEGQASVVKGDSLLLLDDANSYWWLVRVLKTEDVGYIPAENIETPYERLARLNKHRNVDLAAATTQEKTLADGQSRSPLKMAFSGIGKSKSKESTGGESRRVGFAPPTYVEHPGVTWSDTEDEDGEGGEDAEEVEGRHLQENGRSGDAGYENEVDRVDDSLDMEPDDGVEWADEAGREAQKRQTGGPQPGSNNPFAQRQASPQVQSPNKAGPEVRDPAQAGDGTRRVTATPAVAQPSGPLLPSVIVSHENERRSVSGQSITSLSSVVSAGSQRSDASSSSKPSKTRKGSKDDVDTGDGKKKKGVLGGLFSRNKKERRTGTGEVRNSEDSIVSGPYVGSPGSMGRGSEESESTISGGIRSPTQQQGGHGLRVQQQDQALQQAYQTKYLSRSPSSDLHSPTQAEAAAAVAQSAAAMRLAATMAGGSGRGRPSSIILSPNPAGPPLLNVIRLFAGEHTKSESSFKTVLINENTTSIDLIRQAMQRFRLHGAERPGAEQGFYLTIRDMHGEETELGPDEKPLLVFQDAVRLYTDEDEGKTLDDFTPKVNRLSMGSLNSITSLSNHPAIQKLGMHDFEDDSAVKIYFNRRRPGSAQVVSNQGGQPGLNSQWSSYSTGLSTVQENSPERRVHGYQSSETGSPGGDSDATATPPHAQQKYNPSLAVQPVTGSPERFSSPSARFTVQLAIYPTDLPDNLAFDSASEAIIPRSVLKERQGNGYSPALGQSSESRRKLFVVPRNVTVVEATEQGLDRFGIQEGVVDGGDAIEGRGGGKVRYSLCAIVNGEERHLPGSMKLIDAYTSPPNFRPVERMTVQQRRRSREHSQNAGSPEDILSSDPMFVLRRVDQRKSPIGKIDGPPPRSSSYPSPAAQMGSAERQMLAPAAPAQDSDYLSPAAIIAAQRAASRANQKALISAHVNQAQGLDVVVPNKGTFRSSRQFEADGEVMRYSYIDHQGETYDISELLEEEWGYDGNNASPALATIPSLSRTTTDTSTYVTAPSTPMEETPRPPLERKPSQDILQGVMQRSRGNEGKLEEKLERVIDKVKTRSYSTSSAAGLSTKLDALVAPALAAPSLSGRYTPQGGRTTPQLSPSQPSTSLDERAAERAAEATPRADRIAPAAGPPSVRRGSQPDYANTAVPVNRIISRHQQQPSIASIISDMSTQPNTTAEEHQLGVSRDSVSTPATATSSTHPTPPSYSGQIFTRALHVSSPSPAPQQPVKYKDDFGLTVLMACIEARAIDEKAREPKRRPRVVDDVEKRFWGDRIDVVGEGVPKDFADIWRNIESRFNKWDEEIDGLFEGLVQQYATRN